MPADVGTGGRLPGARGPVTHPKRSLEGLPPIRRDLFDCRRYLVPNSFVVSRGCSHRCDLCRKAAFFRGGRFFHTQSLDRVLEKSEAAV